MTATSAMHRPPTAPFAALTDPNRPAACRSVCTRAPCGPRNGRSDRWPGRRRAARPKQRPAFGEGRPEIEGNGPAAGHGRSSRYRSGRRAGLRPASTPSGWSATPPRRARPRTPGRRVGGGRSAGRRIDAAARQSRADRRSFARDDGRGRPGGPYVCPSTRRRPASDVSRCHAAPPRWRSSALLSRCGPHSAGCVPLPSILGPRRRDAGPLPPTRWPAGAGSLTVASITRRGAAGVGPRPSDQGPP